MGCRSTNCVEYSAKDRLIWCPECRRRVLVDGVDERLTEIIAEVVPNDVHVVAEVSPASVLPVLVQRLKGRSSRVLRQEFARLRQLPSLWAGSWFVSTVGGAPLDVVRQYVGNQK